ncbi:PRC and DUF2382 domain-containing protein [Deinococcus maricopensis]|uniref:PRC-barrel domain protein n=1 Tax=Deinococcus maricopensis (strain DSM 21211 / LMG 22137 / NRRL B-23946 / LB-34) TaxID=709986 RepID=E8U5W7_DEIML|nr:DUF2382 domain-containing protein [Deinococcus maricopensis]ADV66456.1 Conserved hypothetical protein CHP02271 [Deinococcus maricopensis DSM 21211]
MANLISLSDLMRDRNYDFKSDNIYDPTGQTAYGMDGEKLGTVRGALVEPDSGRLRYLIVDVGGWFSSKDVLIPVGYARTEDDGVYFDNLTKDQVKDMRAYALGESYDYDAQVSDERVLRGTGYNGNIGYDEAAVGTMTEGAATERRYNYRDQDTSDTMFKTPGRLQLLEERLIVDKDRYVAGSVEIGKHVETRQENVNVTVSRDEVVIERHAVTDQRPVEGAVLGADTAAIRVDLEAERANVRKEAYVTEEVSVGERTVSDTQTFTETVGREVLDVNRTGEARISGEGIATDSTMSAGTRTHDDRGIVERGVDAVDNTIDRMDGKIDRPENQR